MENEKLNFEGVMTLIKETFPDVSDFAHSGAPNYDIPDDFEPLPSDAGYDVKRERRNNYAKTQPLGVVTQVDSHGGEGEGEDWWRVYHFETHGIYVQVEGFYQSYNGTEFWNGWESCSEVSPKQKTITVYE
tara:strand:- start:6050 stop:6442 length:393 start_codon:yes stop_codon:yes gene_type:complete